MATTTQPTTAQELLEMSDDGFCYELVRGELRKSPFAGYEEGRVAAVVSTSLGIHVMEGGLGTTYAGGTGFQLESDPDHVRAPSGAAFIRRERADAVRGTEGFFPGPPDVAVEVISPTDRYTEVEEKVADYLAAGALAVILIDPRQRTVKVHRSPTDTVLLTEADVLQVDDAIPGWQLPISDIFE